MTEPDRSRVTAIGHLVSARGPLLSAAMFGILAEDIGNLLDETGYRRSAVMTIDKAETQTAACSTPPISAPLRHGFNETTRLNSAPDHDGSELL